jgi:hypothetical protein
MLEPTVTSTPPVGHSVGVAGVVNTLGTTATVESNEQLVRNAKTNIAKANSNK